MKRHIKLFLYAEPGTGKSTFASKAPNPFFITTDGNFEWLDLPDEQHKQVFSWKEAKTLFNSKFEGYDTIVVDLIEDLYKMCEQEYCRKNNLEYVGDEGFGKGWRITEDEFVLEIGKLLGQEKNIILLSHEQAYSVKDRRGIEHTKYTASGRLRDKIIDQIEGRVRYFLRAYTKPEDVEGKLIKKRYISLVPKENEFGIARGVDEYTMPHDIPLDWNTFIEVLGIDEQKSTNDVKKHAKVEEQRTVSDIKIEPKEEAKVEVKEEPKVEQKVEVKVETKVEPKVEVKEDLPVVEEGNTSEPAVKTEITSEDKPLSKEDRLAMLRAKLSTK